jgi:hypothetical protein
MLKKFNFLLILVIVIPSFLIIPAQAENLRHPIIWNIKQSPGYLQPNIEPYYSSYNFYILPHANIGLTENFSKTFDMYAIENMPLVYQITGNTTYANKTVEALLNYDNRSGSTQYYYWVSRAAEAYDLIAQTKDVGNTTLDSTNDTIIRDKIAIAADTFYRFTDNYHPYSYPYCSVDDFYLQYSYPFLAITGLVMADYSNTSLSSTPAMWEDLGETVLFVNDTVSTIAAKKGIINCAFNKTNGKGYLDQGYTGYFDQGLYRWFNIYQNVKGESIFKKYPGWETILTENVWSNLPNGYGDSIFANVQYSSTTEKYVYALLDEPNRSAVRWHINLLQANVAKRLLPLSDETSKNGQWNDAYLMQYNFSNETARPPTKLNTLDGCFVVIRKDWTQYSDWLEFTVWNAPPLGQARPGAHNDQLGFEYYSHGDFLMPVAGEVKSIQAPFNTYNYESMNHNVLLIGNSTVQYSRDTLGYSDCGGGNMCVGYGTNLTVLGIDKTNSSSPPFTDLTPAVSGITIDNQFITAKEASVMITNLEKGKILGSPIDYHRVILYPKDYVIIIDRASSAINYNYTNVFHFASLQLNYSWLPYNAGVAPYNYRIPVAQVGHVNGTLGIGGKSIDWIGATPASEYDNLAQSNSVTWDTTNPYGDKVNLTLFTAPKTNYTYQKFGLRITSDHPQTEVWHPIIYFNQPANKKLYRITTLLTKFANEKERIPNELPVSGTGSAIKILSSSGAFTDYIYTGSGTSTFDVLNTDADTAFIRINGTVTDFTLIGGTYLNNGESKQFESSSRLNYIAFNKTGITGDASVSVTETTDLLFYDETPPSYVTCDGIQLAYNGNPGWNMIDATTLKISSPAGDHFIEYGKISGAVTPVFSFTGEKTANRVKDQVTETEPPTNQPSSSTTTVWQPGLNLSIIGFVTLVIIVLIVFYFILNHRKKRN